MIIVALAVLGASIVTGILVALVYLTARGKRPLLPVVARWAARLWIFNFVFALAILYFAMPALTGPYWGGQWLLWPLLLTGLLAIFGGSFTSMRSAMDSFSERVNGGVSFNLGPRARPLRRPAFVEERPEASAPANSATAGILALVLVLVVAAGLNGVIAVATTWFDPNVKSLAAIPNIVPQRAGSALPETDVNHIVLVTNGVAAYLGQQVLASSGQNLGSLYHTDRAEYTLQSVAGHLYWIAPLVYNNVWANLGNWQSPGFVAVDAEDPNATPVLKTTNIHMRYLPDALFNQELVRHVYLSGYTNGDLVDPTLEVDDSWKPYFTISLMQPKQGFVGQQLKQVLLVDPQSGSVTPYAPDKVPAFVDRVIPGATVKTYLTWWGQYHDAPWFNPSGKNQQLPALATDALPELVYNTVDKPVWLVPMTSSAGTDNSSTGVMLFDTRDTTGRFYPLTGLGVGDNVTTTFESNPLNIRGYTVANVQLYQIYGEPTWVATFVQDNTNGQTFQAVGMVDARHLQGANVIMQSNKSLALAAYAQWLADHGVQTNKPIPSGNIVNLQAKVARVSAATENGSTVYYLLLQGQTRIFRAGLQLSAELPLVREGDTVSVTFLDTGQTVVTLAHFDDSNIQLATPTATPSASPAAKG